MTDYVVRFPLAGVMQFYVQADSEDDAIAKAREIDWTLKVEPADDVEVTELDIYNKLHTGNVSHHPLNAVEVIKA